MTKALLRVRFRALFHSMLRQSRQKRRHGTGMTVLFILLFAYVGVVFCGMFALMFSKLAPAYHTAGLDWLYFATAGLMALGLSVFGSVFATQSEIYDAKDNGLLLSMPIPPLEIGGVSFTGKELRSLLGLRSTVFAVSVMGDEIFFQTRGYGHRVGMSQYGAQAMAQAGSGYEEILLHYYTGVSLENYFQRS